MKKSKTNRGFRLYTFKDCQDYDCSLQESSCVEAGVWLGMDTDKIPMHPVLNVPLGVRMLIDRKLAKKLAIKLAAFAETGVV